MQSRQKQSDWWKHFEYTGGIDAYLEYARRKEHDIHDKPTNTK